MGDVHTRSFRAKHQAVYSSAADCERYDQQLCRRQDFQANLLGRLHVELGLTRETRVLDLGAGSGKLSRLLAPHVGPIVALDRSRVMCRVGQDSLERDGHPAVGFVAADQRSIPLRDGCVDLVVAGWSVSAIKAELEEWDRSTGLADESVWREEVDRCILEMERVLADGGHIYIFESQGTASAEPRRRGSHLYEHLRTRGFEESCIRTDYRFDRKDEVRMNY
mmetsp:Transcript_29883/g.81640  ORF Transcript_29883/g.81640 Transcript_29883/m.81640 type:complete len:222 (-) Transcript_29883:299-964(-)|eukprot:scaffold20069_cov32-Tisochrysis_lutea.AAC.2